MDDTTDKQMEFGQWRGKMFSWIVKNEPEYVQFALLRVPQCSSDLFKLAQYADMLQIDRTKPTLHLLNQIRGFEQKWDAFRLEHLAWKNATDIPVTNLPTDYPAPKEYTYSTDKSKWVN